MANKLDLFIKNEHYEELERQINTTGLLSEEFVMEIYTHAMQCTNIQLDESGKDICRQRMKQFFNSYKDICVFNEAFIRSIYSNLVMGAEIYWRELDEKPQS